jgi:alpha-ketoglutarate-dependent taurine dioxygenase
MKISKIPGLGRFGVFIDDLDLDNISHDQWMEIGQIHLDSLVTILRNVKVAPAKYEELIAEWGSPRSLAQYRIIKKYNATSIREVIELGDKLDPEDVEFFNSTMNLTAVEVNKNSKIMRVSGKKNKKGQPMGLFAEGELLWHSNEAGNLCFAPGVSLMGYTGMKGSSTGFVTTVDWYESQTESFRSELDEMIILHSFIPGKINPGLRPEQDKLIYKNMCPEDTYIPLVMLSPGGVKGLHYSVNTVAGIKGMSDADARKVFEYINKTLFVDEYMYDHWYQQNNDICLFDNAITLHRRLGSTDNRVAYRISHGYGKIIDDVGLRYLHEPYNTDFRTQLKDINARLHIKTKNDVN